MITEKIAAVVVAAVANRGRPFCPAALTVRGYNSSLR